MRFCVDIAACAMAVLLLPASAARAEESAASEAAEDAALSARVAECDAGKARLEKAYAECAPKIDRPAEGVMVPVESHPDGSVKVDVEAAKAQFFEKEGFVWCGGVVVREYAPGGEVKMEFRAESCIVDRNAKTGWAPGRVEGVHGGTRLEGAGFYFSFSDESVRIYDKVEIRSNDIKLKGIRL